MTSHRFLPLLLLLTVPLPAPAQAVLSDSAQVSLITILPGDEVWSLWGHSALRVYDPAMGYDESFNYGTFDFGAPLPFLAKFSYGQLDYFLSVQSYPFAVRNYWEVERRPVIEQVLNLTPAQREAVFRFLVTNAQEDNKYYRYDFFFDNCSTRPRDVLVDVLGDQVSFEQAPDPGRTFRQLIDQYAGGQPFADFGMDLGLGRPADREASAWEAMFLPEYLMAAFDAATIEIDGRRQPLVVRRDTVAWSPEAAARESAWPWPTILTSLLFGLGLFLTLRDLRTGRRQRRLFDGLLFGVAGVAGLVLVYLWFISLHHVTQNNLNVLWALPTHLVAAGALVARVQARWLGVYLAGAALLAGTLALGWPLWPQALPWGAWPLAALVAVRGAALAWARRDGEMGRRGDGEREIASEQAE